MRSHRVMPLVLMCFVNAMALTAAAQMSIVVPNAYANTDAPSNNVFPLFAQGSWVPYRFQQVYLGSEIGTGFITEIAFRQDHSRSETKAPEMSIGLAVTISTTTALPDNLSTTMSANLGPDARMLFDSNLVLSTTASTDDPRPFDIVIPVDPPFFFDGSAGNFLLEVTVAQNPPWATFHDQASSTGDSVSRIMCWGAAGCLSGDPAHDVDSGGVVTRFSFGGIFLDGFESGDTTAWSNTVP